VKFCVGKQFFIEFWQRADTGVPQDVFFVFLIEFGLRRAAAFVSSPIHLFYVHVVDCVCFVNVNLTGQQLAVSSPDRSPLQAADMSSSGPHTNTDNLWSVCSRRQWPSAVSTTDGITNIRLIIGRTILRWINLQHHIDRSDRRMISYTWSSLLDDNLLLKSAPAVLQVSLLILISKYGYDACVAPTSSCFLK